MFLARFVLKKYIPIYIKKFQIKHSKIFMSYLLNLNKILKNLFKMEIEYKLKLSERLYTLPFLLLFPIPKEINFRGIYLIRRILFVS